MADKPKYEMNRNLLVHFDAAIEDEGAVYKDSVEFERLSSIEARYTEEKFLAEGGMKKIYSCFDCFTSRVIAKAIPGDQSSAETVDLFIREAKITAGLQHPHIVPVYELAVEGDSPYFTMKLLEGQDLGKALRTKSFEHRELLVIFLKVCDALSYAHSKGVIHLDIKPENIHFDEFGEVLVCDWGLAQKIDDVKASEMFSGTPGFMAPEQYSGKVSGPLSDIYSLGALLYFLLVGKAPLENNKVEDMAIRALEGDIIKPLEAKPELSKSLSAVILKALEPLPENRYQTVSDLSAEIRAYLNGFATEAEEASFLKLFVLLVKRARILAITIFSFLCLIVTMTSVFISNLNKEKEAAEIAEQNSMDIRQETSPELVSLAKKEYKLLNFETAENKVDTALKLDPGNDKAILFKVRCLVGNHKFDDAIKLLERLETNEAYAKFSDYIKTFKKISEKQVLINYENLAPLIDGIRFIDPDLKLPNLKKHFLKTCTEQYDMKDRIGFAERYLKFLTNKKFTWIYSSENGEISLDISRNENLHDVSVLRNITINKLDLYDSPIRDLVGLEGMPLTFLRLERTFVLDIGPIIDCPLKELDISKTNIVNIYGLKNSSIEVLHLNDKYFNHEKLLEFRNLKKLIVSKKGFHRKELELLRTKFEVIVRK